MGYVQILEITNLGCVQIYIYNDVHNGIMMLEILQILVSQIKKKIKHSFIM